MSKEKQTYNPCDDCQYSYSKNGQESGMCKICEFTYFRDFKQSEGEWLFDDGMDRYCSNCGANALTSCFEYKQICTPYCSMCGAKMMFKPKGGAE